ncbi:MAG: FKBP-type peptidyl-prolyl cis-trans isomerase [Chlamydiia bacterium]
MLTRLLLSLALLGMTHAYTVQAEEAPAQDAVAAETQIDMPRLSEELGWLIGHNLNQPPFQFDVDRVIEGIRSGVAGREAPMQEVEYAKQLALLQERAYKQMADKNLQTAEEFLAVNAQKPGVVTLENGKLQVLDVEEGSGPAVGEAGPVLVEYVGKFADGSVFSASAPNDPVRLGLAEVVSGFSKGMSGMKQGGKRTIYIHPELGYGNSSTLGPNQLLVFEITLVDAHPADAPEGDDLSSTMEQEHPAEEAADA